MATLESGLQLTSPPVNVTVTTPAPPPISQSLIATNTVWKYFTGPSGAPANWEQPGFDDAMWPAGPAELGYGEQDEATAVPYGNDPNNKWITTYFRRTFEVNDPAAVTNLDFLLKRDDGARVYLNGHEILRDDLPEGDLTPDTLASEAVSDDGKNFYHFTLDPAMLVNGPNMLAVEIHQSAPTTSDLSFDAALDALLTANRTPGIWFTGPAPGSTFSLPGTVSLTAEVTTAASYGITRVEFFDRDTKIGEDTAGPFAFDWYNPPAGSHVLNAVATDTVGGSFTSAPVNITVTAPPVGSALVSLGATWKYLDNGSDPGPEWTTGAFSDQTWKSGPARLGYGGDGEVTTINAGPSPEERYVTAYFRRQFTLDNPALLDGLLLRLVRDDGAVIYLNGTEVFRDNLQAGPVSFNSLATSTVGGAEETTPVEVVLPLDAMVPGMNVVAAEIHQASITSSDTGFDLELTGLARTNTFQNVYLVSPPNGAHFNTPANVLLSAYAHAVAGPISLVEYFEGDTKLGEGTDAPYQVDWNNPASGKHTITAIATYGAGLQMTSAPVTIGLDSPPAPIQPVAATLVPAQSEWKYWDNANPVGQDWQKPGFDDQTWPTGLARFGWGFDGEMTPITEGRVTHYFRHWFNVDDPARFTGLIFQLVRDDGAVVYLNGQEIYRSNLPTGLIQPNTTASTTVNPPDETTYFETMVSTIGSGLVAGSNVVAVELHQGSDTSSDGGFDFQLLATGTTEGRIYLTLPVAHLELNGTAVARLEAAALAPTGASVSKVEFFIDGVKVGENSTAPYRLNWINVSFGPHYVMARMTDSRGGVLESEPRSLVVSPEPLNAVFIPRGAVWNYLDTGANLGTAWKEPGYNDGSWSSGPAQLGYGDNGEVTTISYGSDGNNKHITTYFRRTFVQPPGAVFSSVLFNLLRDDGAVVWLNGVEVFRSNMPGTTINYLTHASDAVGGTDEQTYFGTPVPVSHLVAGTNVVAVEIHQANATSSDLSFDLEVIGQGYADVTQVPALAMTIDNGHIEVSWPVTTTDWQLYRMADPLAPPSTWTLISDDPETVNNRHVITVQPNGAKGFFRLVEP